jgi:hypothetical protein
MLSLRGRLTYANMASTLALVAALGGGTAIAVNKLNADSVDGVSADRIRFVVKDPKPAPVPFKTVFRGGGLSVQARCYEASGHFMDERVKSAKNNSEIQIAVNGINQGSPDTEYVTDDDFDRGQTLNIPETIQADNTLITIGFAGAKGSEVTMTLQRELSNALGGKAVCLLAGHALLSG